MRRPTMIIGAIGVVLLAAAVLWLLIAPGQLVKYPDDVNKTAVAKGTATLYVDQGTGAPLAKPQSLPLTIERNLKVVESTGSQATIQETSTERLGPAPPEQLLQRYVIDRTSMQNVAADKAYAYTPENVTNRSPAYSINLPLDTGSGPYSVWKNETGRAYTFRRSGADTERNGLTLIPLSGRVAGVPATQAYISALGLKTQMSAEELAPQLNAAGVDLATLLPELGSADRAAVQAALQAPIEVSYVVSADTRLLVEPATGAIVSLAGVKQTLSAAPDLSRFASFGAMLAKPQYADSEVARSTLAALRAMPTGPSRALALEYAQTPASVADIADYAQGLRDRTRLVELWIPVVLAVLGVVVLGVAVAVHVRSGRRVAVAA